MEKSSENNTMSDVMSLLSTTASSYDTADKEKKDPRKRTKEEIERTQARIAKELKNARGSEEYCGKCKQIVYEAEKREIEINGKKEIYHKGCFRCADCNVQLELNSFGSVNRTPYCKSHLKTHRAEIDHSKWGGSVVVNKRNSFVPESKQEIKKIEETENSRAAVEKVKKLREGGDQNACGVCSKVVYLADKMEVSIRQQKFVYHKGCFKCSVCKLQLTLRNYGSVDTVLFCQTHLRENRPQQVKGQSAIFVSPLKKANESYVPGPQEDYSTASYREQPNKDEIEETSVIDQAPLIESKKEEENKVVEEESPKSSTTAPVVAESSNTSDEEEIKREKRRIEREQRRREREEEEKREEEERQKKVEEEPPKSSTTAPVVAESSSTSDEEEIKREKRRKEREQRRREREEEEKREEEERQKRQEQRRKRLEELKNTDN